MSHRQVTSCPSSPQPSSLSASTPRGPSSPAHAGAVTKYSIDHKQTSKHMHSRTMSNLSQQTIRWADHEYEQKRHTTLPTYSQRTNTHHHADPAPHLRGGGLLHCLRLLGRRRLRLRGGSCAQRHGTVREHKRQLPRAGQSCRAGSAQGERCGASTTLQISHSSTAASRRPPRARVRPCTHVHIPIRICRMACERERTHAWAHRPRRKTPGSSPSAPRITVMSREPPRAHQCRAASHTRAAPRTVSRPFFSDSMTPTYSTAAFLDADAGATAARFAGDAAGAAAAAAGSGCLRFVEGMLGCNQLHAHGVPTWRVTRGRAGMHCARSPRGQSRDSEHFRKVLIARESHRRVVHIWRTLV